MRYIKEILIGILVVLLIVATSTCNKRDGKITQLQLDKQTTDSIVNTYGQTIITQEVIITDNKQAIKQLTDSMFNLTKQQDRRIKDAIAFYRGSTVTIIEEKLVPYVDKAERKMWGDSVEQACRRVIEYYEAGTIVVPKTAKDSNSLYTAELTAKIDGIYIDKLSIPDTQYIRFVTIKGGLLKRDASNKRHLFTKKSIQVQVLHTNPLLKITGQNSAIYIPAKKGRWLEKAILVGAGMGLHLLLKQ